jgi:uncharacterized protein (TIGR02118 family)
MIKMTLSLTRRADLTREQFSDYWMNTHWPLVLSVPEVKAHTRRYVQQHNIGGTSAGVTAAPYDGIAEAWFDDIESAHAVMRSENWAAVVAKDDENFLDRSKTLVMFSAEEVEHRP